MRLGRQTRLRPNITIRARLCPNPHPPPPDDPEAFVGELPLATAVPDSDQSYGFLVPLVLVIDT